jgi:hypothetical protein
VVISELSELSQLRQAFEAARGSVRLVQLNSPT